MANPSAQPTPFAQLPDQDLARAYQDGAEAAFVELVERYRVELFHFLVRFVNNRAAAEDLFQETFLQVHLSIQSFDPQRPFKPWLFTVAANKARDHLRRQQRKGGATVTITLDEDGEPGRSVLDLMDGEFPLPDQHALDGEVREQVRQIIQGLPSHLREILLLAYFHQIPYKEIADQLAIPLGTVKSRLHAAVGTFAAAWKARFADAPPPAAPDEPDVPESS